MISPNPQTATSNSSSSPVAPPLLKPFLLAVDWLTDELGLSVPPIVNLGELRALPQGTFGRALADSLDTAGLDPFTTGPRRKQLHDSVHVLTGYGTDLVGEAEVQAFLLGATSQPFHLALIVGITRAMHRQGDRFPLTKPAIRDRLRVAYERGRHSKFTIETWQPETQWALPLTEVRAQAGL